MENYTDALNIMTERFAKDSLIAVATYDGERMHNRMVDAYYENGSFYITTYALSNKINQITAYPDVAVCAVDWFSGHGVGENLGWVLKPENSEIRTKLRKAFSEWYDHANNEKDENCCILKISLTDGMLIKDHMAKRYQVDFSTNTALLSENFGEFK
jgi:general stress protein 26